MTASSSATRGRPEAPASSSATRDRHNNSVMQARHEPPDSLDFFPTPPWATRAFVAHILKAKLGAHRNDTVWEPACGKGHMAEPLRENFKTVHASDIFPYGHGRTCDFLHDVPPMAKLPQWIVTNPPFNLAVEFARRALDLSTEGVCLLVRVQWLATIQRYHLFTERRPYLVAVCAERVPMHRGEWKPDGSTTTDYAWVCWKQIEHVSTTLLDWVPPGCRAAFTKADDALRFAKLAGAPLLDEAALNEPMPEDAA